MHRLTPRLVCLAVAAVAAATIAGALASQHVFGLVPCKLCLWQRQPYYVGVPVALVAALAPMRDGWRRGGLWILALVFLVSAGLGAYHSGVEWGVFAGPADCGGGSGAAPSSVTDFAASLNGVKVVSCQDAAFRFLGLSLAGWNTLISAGLALLAAAAARDGSARRYGSSSVSQYR